MCELVVREVEAEVGGGELLSAGGQKDRERNRKGPDVVTLDVKFQNRRQRLLVSDPELCWVSVLVTRSGRYCLSAKIQPVRCLHGARAGCVC